MNLIVDVGNTRAKYSVFSNGEEIYATTSAHDSSALKIDRLFSDYPQIQKAIVSSVRKDTAELVMLLNNKISTIELDHSTPIPLKIGYKTPDTLGADRIATAIGANKLFPDEELLVIDMGTAITIDYIGRKGEFLGGNISPGVSLRFNSLNQLTHKLPLEKLEEETPAIGQATAEAIRGGVQEGIKNEILGYIHNFMKVNPAGLTILTGGDAIFFAKIIKYPIFVVCNLAMIGLHTILEYNAEDD
ncbi:MAG: type III pantothenate kinase [Prevotellaceae bacterium]|jgi:type III pantothenate kinase|nr:type III pantothenate kinase [Prevotellaceae bacterium]